MTEPLGLLTIDWDSPVPPEERDRLFDLVAATVRRWRLELPLSLALETLAPLGGIVGQGMIFSSPLLALLLPGGVSDVRRLSKLLRDPANLQRLADCIHREAEHAARQ